MHWRASWLKWCGEGTLITCNYSLLLNLSPALLHLHSSLLLQGKSLTFLFCFCNVSFPFSSVRGSLFSLLILNPFSHTVYFQLIQMQLKRFWRDARMTRASETIMADSDGWKQLKKNNRLFQQRILILQSRSVSEKANGPRWRVFFVCSSCRSCWSWICSLGRSQ